MPYTFWKSFWFKLAGGIVFALPLVIHAYPEFANLTIGAIATLEPMIKFFDDISATKRIVLWCVGGLGGIGAFYLMIREIIK